MRATGPSAAALLRGLLLDFAHVEFWGLDFRVASSGPEVTVSPVFRNFLDGIISMPVQNATLRLHL